MSGKNWTAKIKYILGLAILIAVAFLLPRFFFDAKDRESRTEVGRGSRAGINFAALAENYERSVQKRLADFAAGHDAGKDFFVAEVATELGEEEQKEILLGNLSAEQGLLLELAENAWGNSTHFAWDIWISANNIRSSSVETWKKYVVYDTEKVYFICWYADIALDERSAVRVLLDAEDGTLYYLQGRWSSLEEESAGMYFYDGEYENGNLKAWNAMPIAMLWVLTNMRYESDWEYAEIAEENGIRKEYFTEYHIAEETFTMMLENVKKTAKKGDDPFGLITEAVWKELQTANDSFAFPLHYGEQTLEIKVDYRGWRQGETENDVHMTTFALRELAERIPALQE